MKKAAAATAGGALSIEAINRATLARQMLLARENVTPRAAIKRLVALQAQWPRPPFLGLWTRLEKFGAPALAKLLHDRKVVRATSTRGTLHVMLREDFVAFRPLLEPTLTRAMTSVLRGRKMAVDYDEVLAEGRRVLAKGPRTFEEIRERLRELFPHADDRGMGFLVRTQLPLVQVPNESKWAFPTNPQFDLAENWLGEKIANTGDGARELVRRYLAAFGPATVADAQTWSGLSGLAPTFAAIADELVTFEGPRGRTLYDLPDAPRPPADTPAPVRFLPEFDELLLGSHDRKRVVDDAHKKLVFLPGLRVAPTVLVDGRVAGTWKAARTRREASLAVALFAKVGKKARAELEAEAQALVRFMEPDAASFAVTFA